MRSTQPDRFRGEHNSNQHRPFFLVMILLGKIVTGLNRSDNRDDCTDFLKFGKFLEFAQIFSINLEFAQNIFDFLEFSQINFSNFLKFPY